MNEADRAGQIDRVAAWLLAFACCRSPGERDFCGTYLIRVARRLKDDVRRSFTEDELDGLMALLPPLYAGGKNALPPLSWEQNVLLARAGAILPRVRRTMGRRQPDEDCMAIALDILGLWEPEEEGAAWEIDVPRADA